MNLQFWLSLVGPWILDLAGGQGVLTSLFGSLLWGLSVALSASRLKMADTKGRAFLGSVLAFLWGSWVTYWVESFFEAPRRLGLTPEMLRWVRVSHGALLAAGGAMVVILLVFSVLWLIQEASIRRPSWKRRSQRLHLPSLESLNRVCAALVVLAFTTWGLGLALALMSVTLDSTRQSMLSWITDVKLVGASALWILVLAAFQLGHWMRTSNPWLYRSYFVLSLIFFVGFSLLLWGPKASLHEPLRWFVR